MALSSDSEFENAAIGTMDSFVTTKKRKNPAPVYYHIVIGNYQCAILQPNHTFEGMAVVRSKEGTIRQGPYGPLCYKLEKHNCTEAPVYKYNSPHASYAALNQTRKGR